MNDRGSFSSYLLFFVLLVLLAPFTPALAGEAPEAAPRQPISDKAPNQGIAAERGVARRIADAIGLYADAKVQAYVSRVGLKLAAASERPDASWSFQVVDDPSVDVFSLPGNSVFVTRGLLTALTTEGELAAALAHQIGHLTARREVARIGEAELARIGLVSGTILSPDLTSFGDLALSGLGVVFPKNGSDDERQADERGLRCMTRAGYDPREMPQLFEALRRAATNGPTPGRVPTWLQTHGESDDRFQQISAEIDKRAEDFSGLTVGREAYLAVVDRMPYGADPRHGFFRGGTFHQPELAVSLRFPDGWRTSSQKAAVGAISPNEDALVVMVLTGRRSAQEAAGEFFAPPGIVAGEKVALAGKGGASVTARLFTVHQTRSDLTGVAAFVEEKGHVFQLLAYTLQDDFDRYRGALLEALASFRKIGDRATLDLQPRRLALVKLAAATKLRDFDKKYPSTVDLGTLAIVNGVDADDRLAAGTQVKRIVGGKALPEP